jgi:hypothetical protein
MITYLLIKSRYIYNESKFMEKRRRTVGLRTNGSISLYGEITAFYMLKN